MPCKRCLPILTVCTIVVVTGMLVFASMSYAAEKKDRKAEAAQEEKSQQVSRLELQNDLMRFAQMFIRDFTLKIYTLETQSASNAVRFALSQGELRTVNTLLTIATGPDAVDNLLDMIIFVTLGRLAIEKSWPSKVLGNDKGAIPAFFKQMEKEIWGIAEKVLIPRYQKELRNTIRRWQARHPDQFFIGGTGIGGVGFDSLADMLGESEFKDAAKSGFLLPEVNEATQSVDEVRNLAERLLFFVKYLPYIARTTAETGVYDVLDQPETIRLLSNIDRLTTAIEGIGDTAKQLPDTLSKEREKLMDDLLRSDEQLRALSGDLRQTLAAGEKAAASANEAILSADKLATRILERGEPGSFDIQDYIDIANQATEAAKQTQTLVGMVDKLSSDPGLKQRALQLKQGLDALLLRAFLWAALLIVFFFVALFAYRTVSQRFFKG